MDSVGCWSEILDGFPDTPPRPGDPAPRSGAETLGGPAGSELPRDAGSPAGLPAQFDSEYL